MNRLGPSCVLLGFAVLACSSGPPAEVTADTGWHETTAVNVRVTLDGEPVVATVVQGGVAESWTTDRDGRVTISVDPTVTGDIAVLASHAEARIGGVLLSEPPSATVDVALTRFDPTDNPAYVFADPGPADFDASTTANCVHCHITLHEDWRSSAHASAASDPRVTDVYQGVASAVDEASCDGTWTTVPEPGTGSPVGRCLVEAGVVEATGGFGGCADCHAPGIDGALGGRDLLEATGVAFSAGVHCDVCHKVESVDLGAEAGVAGALHIVRPSEVSPSPVLGAWKPLSFGPFDDVVNPVMGAVAREHFHTGELCGGCHEQHQPVLVIGATIDHSRWEDGRLPIHTTWSEWESSGYNPSAPCQTCHMPPDAGVGNSADLYNLFDDVDVGVSAGWERPSGEVRRHQFLGPRSDAADLLGMAATLDVLSAVVGDTLEVSVTVTNVGPGHALPTGEPMRNMLVLVEARCDGAPIDAIGGDVVPAMGGAFEEHTPEQGSTRWEHAGVGDIVRFVRHTGAWIDYAGYGPFGDGTFSAEQKGLPQLEAVGSSIITAIADGNATLSPAAPVGWDLAWLVSSAGLPVEGESALPRAGSPGFSFARVLLGADGAEMVPHHLAVDVVRDNRLLPGESWTSQHSFPATCGDPEVSAQLVYREFPWAQASLRAWTLTESIVEAR